MNNWEYAESIESEKIVKIEKKYGHFINGEFVSPNSKNISIQYLHQVKKFYPQSQLVMKRM